MKRYLSIEDVLERFPDYRVAAVTAVDLTIPAERPDWLDDEVKAAEVAVQTAYGDTGMNDIPGIAEWRMAYKAFGIKKTSYRCSVERLVRSCIKGRGLPSINAFVDAYNMISVRHVMPLGADDLAKVDSDVAFRFSQDGDSFIPLGDENRTEDPPKAGEVVYADAAKVLCRRWNWYQDDRSPVSPSTNRAIVTIQSMGAGEVEVAADDLKRLLIDACGATVSIQVANSVTPVVEIEGNDG